MNLVSQKQAARAAVESLTAGEFELAEISQLDLQMYLWHDLPRLGDMPESLMRHLPDGLAEVFERNAMPGHARICRSDTTRDLLTAWSRVGFVVANRRFGRALDRSGVVPVDTDTWQWSERSELEEYLAYDDCSRALEAAIAAGRLVPGAARWRSHQRAVVDEWLDAPADRADRLTPRQAIERERLAVWLSSPPHGLAAIPMGPRSSIAEAMELPDGQREISSVVNENVDRETITRTPLVWLIEHAATPHGIQLTDRGRLARTSLIEMAEHFDWLDPRAGEVRGEAVFPLITRLRELALAIGVVRRRRNRLVATPGGCIALSEPSRLAGIVGPALCCEQSLAGVVTQLSLAFLLTNQTLTRSELVKLTTSAVFIAGWRATVPHPDSDDYALLNVEMKLGECVELLGMAGLVNQSGARPDITYKLTAAGRAGALSGLRACALGPIRRANEDPS